MMRTSPSGTTLMSAEVPPISTVIRLCASDLSPAQRPPLTPPAGPDMRIVTGRSAAPARVVTPPFDCITRIWASMPFSRSAVSRLLR